MVSDASYLLMVWILQLKNQLQSEVSFAQVSQGWTPVQHWDFLVNRVICVVSHVVVGQI